MIFIAEKKSYKKLIATKRTKFLINLKTIHKLSKAQNLQDGGESFGWFSDLLQKIWAFGL